MLIILPTRSSPKDFSIFVNLESHYLTNTKSEQLSLYPHEIEKFIIVVPNQVQRKSTLFLSIIRIICVWVLVIFIFSIFQKIIRTIQMSRTNKFCAIFFNTFVLSFLTVTGSMNTTKIASSKQLSSWILSVFAVWASILCSGILFVEFSTSLLMPSINSLEDLGLNSHIDIWIPMHFDESMKTWLQQQ